MPDPVCLTTLNHSCARTTPSLPGPQGSYTLTVMVENLGRVNYGKPPLIERKGLGGLAVEGGRRGSVKIYSLDFTKAFVDVVQEILENKDMTALETGLLPETPSFTLGTLEIEDDQQRDTHLLTTNWARGVVALNGEVIGRLVSRYP